MTQAAIVPEQTRKLVREVILPHARAVDEEGRFPKESVSALAEAGYLRWFVPRSLGGLQGTVSGFSEHCAIVGEGCTSTALILAMHAQQTAVLAKHALDTHADLLRKVASGYLLASVTTEAGKGGHLLTAHAPLIRKGSQILFERTAPVVSYGGYANGYLATMRESEEALPESVALVAFEQASVQCEVRGEWNAMGMRGTCSVPMHFKGVLTEGAILPGAFRSIALQTMVPVGHIAWAAAWYGSARGALRRLTSRRNATRRTGDSAEPLYAKLAEIRLNLDLVWAVIEQAARTIDQLWSSNAQQEAYEAIPFNVLINNVKLAAARLCFAAASSLVELAGLAEGYLPAQSGIERVFRDLRAASLMFHDDRLLATNGRLLLVEETDFLRRAASP